MTSLRLIRISALTALVLLIATASASADLVAPPVGPPPLRYRDAIFASLTITKGLTYGSAPDGVGNPVTLTLDMFRPTGDTQTSRPAIVLIHGGGFSGGDSKNGAMVKMANAFAQRGYVAVSINYRLLNTAHEKCGVEAQPSQTCITAALAAQHDAQAAVRWLRRNAATYGIDSTRIAVGGGSAGAATALTVAVNSTDPGTSGNPGYSSKVDAAISISGALPGTFAKSFFDAADSPTLMFEGTADTVVPYPAAAQTAAEMRSAGINVVFEALQGGGHVPMAAFGDVIISQSTNFAYDQLNLARAAGQRTAAPTARITAPRNGGIYAAGQLVKTSFSCTEGAGGPGLASCRDSRGAAAPGGRLDTTHPGRHTYRVTATSGDGFQGSASITYRVKAPQLSHLTISPRRFRAAAHGPTLLRRGGAKIIYRDPIAATTRFQVFRQATGVKRGKRLIGVGSFSRRDHAGTMTLHFSGRLGGHALAPGSYVLKASAARDGQRGGTLSTAFRILAR
jgi:acetyl esterase/lipase